MGFLTYCNVIVLIQDRISQNAISLSFIQFHFLIYTENHGRKMLFWLYSIPMMKGARRFARIASRAIVKGRRESLIGLRLLPPRVFSSLGGSAIKWITINNFQQQSPRDSVIAMGQKSSESLRSEDIELSNWIEAVEDPARTLFLNVNPYRKRLLVNKNTGKLIEEYELQFLNQEDFNSYSKDIELRKEERLGRKIEILSSEEASPYKTSPYIYKVKYFTNTSIAELCSTIYNGLLYIQKVDLRLKEINDIPLSDQLYLYQCCLEGFKILYEQVGYFDITEEMIFFSKEGKVKVWMNPNLSKHHPNYEPGASSINAHSIEVQGSQTEMLKNLINLIEENTDSMSSDHHVHFSEYLREKGIIDRLSFYKAIDEFHLYIETYRLTVNNSMKSIFSLFHSEAEHSHLYESQSESRKSEVQETRQKDYESLKNSSHEMSFQKLNRSSHNRQAPNRFNQPSPLEVSRASKNSFNSEYNSRKLDSQGKLANFKRTSHQNLDSNSQSQIASHPNGTNPASYFVNEQTDLTFSRTNPNTESKREIITFCPPEKKVFQPEPLITKYRSLEKAPAVISAANRPITFSYQSQQAAKLPPKPIESRAVNPQEHEIPHKERKESIIDKLNSPAVLHTVNTIKTQASASPEPFPSKPSPDPSRPEKINYFSTSQTFILDKEIAEDMMKYLGFNPNLI